MKKHYREHYEPEFGKGQRRNGDPRRLKGPTEEGGELFDNRGLPRRGLTKKQREYLEKHPRLFDLDEVAPKNARIRPIDGPYIDDHTKRRGRHQWTLSND